MIKPGTYAQEVNKMYKENGLPNVKFPEENYDSTKICQQLQQATSYEHTLISAKTTPEERERKKPKRTHKECKKTKKIRPIFKTYRHFKDGK